MRPLVPLTPYGGGGAPGATPQILPPGVAAPSEWQDPTLKYLQGLAASALSGATELVGYTVPGATEFRQENPVVGTISQFASSAVPYVAWMGGVRKFKTAMNVVDKIVGLEKAPFAAGAIKEAAILAPFEVGRVAASQIIPGTDQSFGDMVSSAALDLTLSAGIGGLAKTIAAGGTRARRIAIPDLDLAAPPPLQLRKLKELLAGKTLTIEQQGAANNRLKDLSERARVEEAPKQNDYIGKVNNNEALTRYLNSLFNMKGNSGLLTKRFFAVGAKRGFSSESEWRQAAKWNSLPENFDETGRYFRELTFQPTGGEEAAAVMKDLSDRFLAKKITMEELVAETAKLTDDANVAKRAANVDKELRAGMQSMGFSWLMGKEENGMFVLAKKTKGKFGEGKVNDRWVLFKTDMPGLYLPKHKAWQELVNGKLSWDVTAAPLEIGGIYGLMRKFHEMFPKEFFETVATPHALAALVPKGLTKSSSELVQAVKDGSREYLAPASGQFKKQGLAQQVYMTAKLGHNEADTLAHQVVYGQLLPGKHNLFREALSQGVINPEVDSISSITGPLSDSHLEQVVKLSNDLVDPANYDALVAEGVLSAEARQAADRLEALANVVELDHQAITEGLGLPYSPRPVGNLGLTRRWEGDPRILLADETGAPKIVVSAKNKRAAQEKAKRLIESDPTLHIAEEVDISKTKGARGKDIQISPAIKSTMEKGGGLEGLRGFKWDHDPVVRKELLQHWQEAYAAKFKWQAERGVDDLLAQPRAILNEIDPTTTRILNDRLRDLRGEPGKLSQAQNEAVDRVLAPMIGPNSASKIVSVTNTGLSLWHLGMGNVAHPIMNAITFIQTVVPEVAMILGATMKDLTHYRHALARGTRGPVGALAFLSPMKILVNSFRMMGNPDEMLQRLIARSGAAGVTQPRVAEEFIGLNATKVKDLRAAISSPGGFATWVKELGTWLPANSERMSRVHAFTVGYLTGKDVMGIVDEERLYQWAKEFTEKTMYNYTTADRPRIFTGPFGSSMGLFKTWMANYMAAMLEYSGQALKGNVAPLFWQTAGTAAVGGVAATPLYWIADGFSKAFTDKDILQQTYDNLSEGPADALMFGMPAALTGISLYSQASSPFANPQRDASMLWSNVLWSRMQAMGRVAGNAYDHWHATGEHPGSTPAVWNALVQAFAPATIARATAAASGEDVINSLSSGYPLISNVSITDRVLYGLKFNPLELDKAMAIADTLFRKRDKANALVSELGKAFAEAMERGDGDAMSEIYMQATAWGLDPGRVLHSAQTRGQLAAEPLLERTFSPELIAPAMNVLGQ